MHEYDQVMYCNDIVLTQNSIYPSDLDEKWKIRWSSTAKATSYHSFN